MAPTKQTARKSTFGKQPRKQLATKTAGAETNGKAPASEVQQPEVDVVQNIDVLFHTNPVQLAKQLERQHWPPGKGYVLVVLLSSPLINVFFIFFSVFFCFFSLSFFLSGGSTMQADAIQVCNRQHQG